MIDIYLLLGSNIEPRETYLRQAELEIRNRIGSLLNASRVYESAPWGFDDDTPFLNKVLVLSTELDADTALEKILQIENELGRVRKENFYSSRSIDIDILFYGSAVVEKKELQIPHPRLHLRKFTLLPLVEVASGFVHPKIGLSTTELLKRCSDDAEVSVYKNKGVEV